MRFAVVYGSTRSERKGIRAARFLVRSLQERGHEATLVDAQERPLPLLDRMHKEYDDGEAPEAMQWIHEVFAAADGFVVVSGEYNHSVPPALKNLLDHYQQEFFFKPAGIVTYSAGPFGGVRVAPHLRAILGELGMVTCSIMMPVSKVGPSFEEDGTPKDDAYERRVGRFLGELEWYADALATKRAAAGTPF